MWDGTNRFVSPYPEGRVEEEALYDLQGQLAPSRVPQEAADEGEDGREEVKGEVLWRDLLQEEAKELHGIGLDQLEQEAGGLQCHLKHHQHDLHAGRGEKKNLDSMFP